MKQQLEQRLQELETEFENGQKKLADLEAQAGNLRNTLLRISGAIQVLKEELGKTHNQPQESAKNKKSETDGAE
ncbi:hypothetical protein JXA70_01355 [candidate division KSB1 bacterium]|nr:hypothetical protein [candidate division KSB1 bacterium]